MRAASNWRLNLESAHQPGAQKGPSSKTKFTCGQCGQKAWGKPDLAIICEPCGMKMRDSSIVRSIRQPVADRSELKVSSRATV